MALPVPLPSQPRRRGGQPGNQNARKQGLYSVRHPGPFASIPTQAAQISRAFNSGALTPQEVLEQTAPLVEQLSRSLTVKQHTASRLDVSRLLIKITRLEMRAQTDMLPALLQARAFENIAHDPLGWILFNYRSLGIPRDADSFFPVPKLSARNSPLRAPLPALQPEAPSWQAALRQEAGVPAYATSLTDAQWELLIPLIPPDPALDWLGGEPPVIIAANRFKLSRYAPDSDFNDFSIMQAYRRFLDQYPVLKTSDAALPRLTKRGRPRSQPSRRAMLDAILWKLATARDWSDLPPDFPSMRRCSRYYRRLFLSGRFYTILLALHNHLHLEEDLDIFSLNSQDVFIATPSQALALRPGLPPSNRNYMALLFLQLAREAYTRASRLQKERDPFHKVLPVFKGIGSLSDPRQPSPPLQTVFEPLEQSSAAKALRKIERDQRKIRAVLRSRAKGDSSSK